MLRLIAFVTVMRVLCILAYRERAVVTSVGRARCPAEAVHRHLTPGCLKESLSMENRRHQLDAYEVVLPVPSAYMRVGAAGICNCIKRDNCGTCVCKDMLHSRCDIHSKRTKYNVSVDDGARVSTGLYARRYNTLFFVRQALLCTCICSNIGSLCRSADILVQCIPILLHISLLPCMKAVESGKQVQNQTIECRYCHARYSHSRYIGVCTPCGNLLMMNKHRNASRRKKNICRCS